MTDQRARYRITSKIRQKRAITVVVRRVWNPLRQPAEAAYIVIKSENFFREIFSHLNAGFLTLLSEDSSTNTEMLLEVCVDCLESARSASNGGAGRLEVCSSLSDGGLTPSAGLVTVIKQSLPDIPIYAILRCRPGSDFCYSGDEIQVMMADLQVFKSIGVQGFVFGALNIDGSVDEESCRKIISNAHPLPVTFHRAFDVCNNPLQSMETIITLGFERILTSGQQGSAGSDLACNLIKELIEKASGRIVIMPGAGISLQNINRILATGAKEIHGSLKMKKQLPVLQNRIEMGSTACETINVTDENLVRNVVSGFLKPNKT